MAFNDNIRGIYQKELDDIRTAGHFQGRAHHLRARRTPRSTSKFPAGAERKRVINMCANNYLGLSSHPDVVEAARKGLDRRGYGMSSVRFICGTQDIHKELEGKLTTVPGHRGHHPVPILHGRQRRRFRGRAQRAGRDDLRPPGARLDRRRHAPVQGPAGHLQAFRHGPPRGKTAAARRRPRQADHHRRLLFHGRRPGQAGPDRGPGRKIQRPGLRRRLARQRLHRQDRPRHPRALRRGRQDRHHHHHPGQGPGRRLGRLRLRPARTGGNVPPEGPALPVLQHHPAGGGFGRHRRARHHLQDHRAPRQAGSATPPSGERG